MKNALIHLILLCLCAGSALGLELGFYPGFQPDGKSGGDKQVFALEKQANRVLWQEKVKDGTRTPEEHKISGIQDLLRREKSKECVLVWFDKSIMWSEKEFVQTRAVEVTRQMRQIGYKRVIILGAHGSGVHYVADTALQTRSRKQVADGKNPLPAAPRQK